MPLVLFAAWRLSAAPLVAVAFSPQVSGTSSSVSGGGEIEVTPPLDVVSVLVSARADGLSRASGDVQVQTSDVALDLGAFLHVAFALGHGVTLRPGGVVFADLGFERTRTLLGNAHMQSTDVVGGVGYGARVECELGHAVVRPQMALQGAALTRFSVGPTTLGTVSLSAGVAW
jgi:hypothetical protein